MTCLPSGLDGAHIFFPLFYGQNDRPWAEIFFLTLFLPHRLSLFTLFGVKLELLPFMGVVVIVIFFFVVRYISVLASFFFFRWGGEDCLFYFHFIIIVFYLFFFCILSPTLILRTTMLASLFICLSLCLSVCYQYI